MAADRFLFIESFHTCSDVVYARGYEAWASGGHFVVARDYSEYPLSTLVHSFNPTLPGQVYITEGTSSLNESHARIVSGKHPLKVEKAFPTSADFFSGLYYKVKAAPVLVFTDDTSGMFFY